MIKTEIIAEEGKQELFVIRHFAAPIQKVFRAFTDPNILERWFMPTDRQLAITRFDPTAGGSYTFQLHHPEQGFKGVFHEVVFEQKISRTSEFFGLPFKLDPLLEIIHFETVNATETKVKIQMLCPSVEYRNGMLGANMQSTFDQTHQKLDEILNEM